MITPDWLPDMVSVNGVPDETFARLYGIFQTDFHDAKPELAGLTVWWDRRVSEPPYEEGFWHLITRTDYDTGDRLLDPRRAERLPWCGPTIENCGHPCVLVWDYTEGNGGIRTYVWLEKHDYALIFEKKTMRRGKTAFLVTAFHIDGSRKREDLQRKYAKRIF